LSSESEQENAQCQAVLKVLSPGIDLNATKGVANQKSASISSCRILNNCLRVPNCYDGALGLRSASVCGWLCFCLFFPKISQHKFTDKLCCVLLGILQKTSEISAASKSMTYASCCWAFFIACVLARCGRSKASGCKHNAIVYYKWQQFFVGTTDN
jgi:hypothetical protein